MECYFSLGAYMKNITQLKPRQITALQLLATGTPANQVAARLEISTMTLYRWQQQPEFEAKLRVITHSGLEEIAKKMNATTLTAIETLQEVLCNMGEPTNIRMKAALGVLGTMAAVNNALEKSLQHRAGDFDLQERFSGQSFTFDSGGNPIQKLPQKSSELRVVI